MYTYLLLPTLPHPPQHFVDAARAAADELVNKQKDGTLQTKFNSNFVNRKLQRNGKEYNSRSLAGATLGADFEHWIKNNIVPDFIEAGVRVSVGHNTSMHGVHIDGVLNGAPLVKLNYFIDLGGDNVITSFWQEHNQPIVRSVDLPNTLTVNNYEQLTLIEQTVFPVCTWTALNTNVLHGVDNITGLRINFTVLVDGRSLAFKI